MVFRYLYELFWEMHLLFWEFQFWSEKCTKATEKNCKSDMCIVGGKNASNVLLSNGILIQILVIL